MTPKESALLAEVAYAACIMSPPDIQRRIGKAMDAVQAEQQAIEFEQSNAPFQDMKSDELRAIARKLTTYARLFTGDKEAREMAQRCTEVAGFLDVWNARKLAEAGSK